MFLGLGRAAKADLVYEYVFDQTIYVVNPGETIDVHVSLLETVTGGDYPLLESEGLIGAGVRVRFDNAPLPSNPAAVTSLADILPNAAQFDDPFGLDVDLVPGSSAGFSESVQITSPAVFGTAISAMQFRIELGVFRFTSGSNPGETTFLTAIDRSLFDETITGSTFTVLDGLIGTGSARIQVRSVPEPGGLLLVASGLLMLGLHMRHRTSAVE